jgi:Ca-activated chloride channel homolog
MEAVPMSLAASWVAWLAAAAAIAIAIAFALSESYRRRQLERAGDAAQLRRMTASLSMRRRVVKAVLVAVALPLALLALARPQVEGEATWARRGIDVAVVMDYSLAMLARDVYPSRVARMEREVEDLFERLEADRVAVVPFAGAAAHVPLTHDHQAAMHVFRGLSPRDMPPGSDVGEGLRVARCLLRPDQLDAPGCERLGGRGGAGEPTYAGARAAEQVERGRAIVLYTDGEDTGGRVRQELERALDLGIEVYLVGVGTTAGELIPQPDPAGGETWMRTPDGESFVVARLHDGALRELAQLAGGEGHYIRLDPAQLGGREVLERLRRLQRGDLGDAMLKRPEEVYGWFLIPAFLLLVLEAGTSERRRRRRKRGADA